MDFDFDEQHTADTPQLIKLPCSQSVVFDIETSPAWTPGESLDAAREYCRPLGIEFDPDSIGQHPGEFDPTSVKVGNLKDYGKIEAKIEAAREKHAAAVEKFNHDQEFEEHIFWHAVVDHAALSPVTGVVLAIGYLKDGELAIASADEFGSEELLLTKFWQLFMESRSNGEVMTGWNINSFDVPFLIARSAKLGIQIPRGLFSRGKWLSDTFVDCMQLWGQQHDPWKQKRSFAGAKDVARFFGCKHRSEDEIEGREFWKYFLGSEADRQRAVKYLTNDVTEEAIIASRLGII